MTSYFILFLPVGSRAARIGQPVILMAPVARTPLLDVVNVVISQLRAAITESMLKQVRTRKHVTMWAVPRLVSRVLHRHYLLFRNDDSLIEPG